MAWWEMTIDNSYSDMMDSNRDELFAYIQYFQRINDNHLKLQDKVRWIQVNTILAELEVCIDRNEEEDEQLFNELAQCLEHLWKYVEQAMI